MELNLEQALILDDVGRRKNKRLPLHRGDQRAAPLRTPLRMMTVGRNVQSSPGPGRSLSGSLPRATVVAATIPPVTTNNSMTAATQEGQCAASEEATRCVV